MLRFFRINRFCTLVVLTAVAAGSAAAAVLSIVLCVRSTQPC